MNAGIRENVCLSAAGLAEGTNANTFKTTYAITYNIGGRTYYKGATDNLTFSTGTALAAKEVCVFFVWINSAGTVTTTQSSIVPNATAASGYVKTAFEWPHSSTLACIGALRVVTNNSATFTPGSTDLAATDVVDTFYDVALDYSQPITDA